MHFSQIPLYNPKTGTDSNIKQDMLNLTEHKLFPAHKC